MLLEGMHFEGSYENVITCETIIEILLIQS